MKLIRSLYWYVSFGFSLFFYLLPAIRKSKIEKMNEKELEEYIFLVLEKWSDKRLKSAGCNTIITGNTNYPEGACLFVSNHQSNIDTGVILRYINKPKGFMAKQVIRKAPILGKALELMPSVFIDRDDPKSAGRALLNGIKFLKKGHSLVIFPEGTRSKKNEMTEFKEGAFIMAQKSKVPIVPITICNTHKIIEANNNLIVPQTVFLHIHDPIYTDDLKKSDLKNLSDKTHLIIESKLKELNKQSIN